LWSVGQSGKLLLALASLVIFGSKFRDTHGHILLFVLQRYKYLRLCTAEWWERSFHIRCTVPVFA
jgi:hypothetical protein